MASGQADLALVGGKSANLARLAQAGFPVPGGFLVTTDAYRDYVAANHLAEPIINLLAGLMLDDPASLEQASSQIRARFASGQIPPGLAQELLAAYRALGEIAIAVRSSATTEDLPELSFAGQQDTFLNVLGAENFLKAVVSCWSSLWTARAIGYRMRNRVPHAGVALAVVVQQMVESQASGVLFTANPLSGLRSETVIDATLGLGEALVSGQVQPDHYVVDPGKGGILSKSLGAKELSIHGKPGGGTYHSWMEQGAIQALPDEAILDLTHLGQQVAGLDGVPQDIEWAWADGNLYLLQTRPITSLFPLPEGLPYEPLKVFFSFGAVQGMLDPITPLGRNTLCLIFAMGARLFGVRVTAETQTALYTAGERLWVNFTPILTNSVGRRIVPVVLSMVEPTIHQAVEQIQSDPRLQPTRKGIRIQTRLRLARFFLPVGFNILLNLVAPRRRREFIVQNGERMLEQLEQRSAAIQGDRWQKLAGQTDLLPDLAEEQLPITFRLFVSAVAAGMISWNMLNMLAARARINSPSGLQPDTRDLVLQVTRGMPFNPTTEMDLALWETAKAIYAHPPSAQAFQAYTPAEIAVRFKSGELPEMANQTVTRFLKVYGGRGLGEIDLGRPRWAEEPTHVFEMLASFLQLVSCQIEDENQAPDIVFRRSAGLAEQAVTHLAQAVRKSRFGWLKARLVRFFAGRARQLMGARESPKFFAVRMMGLLRRELLKSGQEFVSAGELSSPDDLFYLTLSEMKAFARQEPGDWTNHIARRRGAYQRELLRRQIPRLLVSDGRAFYAGLSSPAQAENIIHGSPVSPGSVQGRVRVVLDPRRAGLQPGEILVCPGTDPSWTPLFLSAGGLVMETGGMMTHGAVVAREYGIPAIVGVDQATQRLQTGQLIRLDGSSGQIVIL